MSRRTELLVSKGLTRLVYSELAMDLAEREFRDEALQLVKRGREFDLSRATCLAAGTRCHDRSPVGRFLEPAML